MKIHHGKNLDRLLWLRFSTQTEAAGYFGVSQGRISTWIRQAYFSRVWFERYAEKLAEIGLNPEYITNPAAPLFVAVETATP
jgi:hypothetical protein